MWVRITFKFNDDFVQKGDICKVLSYVSYGNSGVYAIILHKGFVLKHSIRHIRKATLKEVIKHKLKIKK